jgi:response regulator of citrate/malate metabolism
MCNKKQRLYILERDNHKCVWCGIGTTYNDKPLVLQIDHIDGNRKNNSEDNLRTMCPNCHSQTETYTFNKMKSDWENRLKKHFENMTQEQIQQFFLDHTYGEIVDITGTSHRTLRKYVKENNIIPRHKAIKQDARFVIEKEELEKLIQTHTLKEIGEMYGVSDAPVRKKLKKWNIKVDREVWIQKIGRSIRKKHSEMRYKTNTYHFRKDAKKVLFWDENTQRKLWFPSINDAIRHLPLCKVSIVKLIRGQSKSIKGFSFITE